MKYGAIINGINTLTSYGLFLLADISIKAPARKENILDIPGAHGSLDLSCTLTGEPVYSDGEISFTLFKAVDDFDLSELRAQLMPLHGRSCTLKLPTSGEYYYTGTVYIGDIQGYNSGRIPITFTAYPWMLADEETSVGETLTGEYKQITLINGAMAVTPAITVTENTTIMFANSEYELSAGTHRLLDIRLAPGTNTLSAKLLSAESGNISIAWQNGRLI